MIETVDLHNYQYVQFWNTGGIQDTNQINLNLYIVFDLRSDLKIRHFSCVNLPDDKVTTSWMISTNAVSSLFPDGHLQELTTHVPTGAQIVYSMSPVAYTRRLAASEVGLEPTT